MEFNSKKTDDGLGIWKITINGEEWKKFLKNSETTNLKNIQIEGFRKGKAPINIAKSRINQEMILNEAKRMAIKKGYEFASKQNTNIKPISEVNLNVKKIDNLEFIVEFNFDIKPEISIKKYKGFKDLKKDKVSITEKMINDEIKKVREKYAILEVKKTGKVVNGNHVLIDFVGKIDGKEFPGGRAQNYGLDIGSKSFIPGFEDSIIGMKVKDKKNIFLTFPKNYHAKEFSGKDVVFEVKLKEIKTKKLPQLNNEFVEDLKLENIKTIDDFKKYVKNNIAESFEKQILEKFVSNLLDLIAKDSKIIVPNSMIINQRKQLFKEFEQKVVAQKITIKEYINKTGLNLEDINNELEKDAKRQIINSFIFDFIISKEKINVKKDEIENEYKKLAKKFGLGKEFNKLKGIVTEKQIINSIQNEKVARLLFENNG